MKKTFFLITLISLLSLSFNLSALDFISLGLKGGAVVSNIHSSDTDFGEYTPKLGYSINASIMPKFNRFLGLRFEPGIILKGAKNKDFDDSKLHSTYYNMPVLLSISPIKRIHIEIGPEFSFLTKAVNEEGDNMSDLYDKKFEVGFIVGASAKIISRLDLGARYSMSLTPIIKMDLYDEEGNPTGNDITLKNRYTEIFLRLNILK